MTLKLPQDNRRRLQGRIEAIDEAAGTITFIVDKAEVVVSADNIDKARIMPDWVALGLAPSKPTGPAPKRRSRTRILLPTSRRQRSRARSEPMSRNCCW